MPFSISTKNLAAGLPPEAWFPGSWETSPYPVTNLANGSMATPWRSAEALSFWPLEVDLGADTVVDLVAAFDVRPAQGHVTGITVEADSRHVGSIGASKRGDGALLTPGQSGRRWVIGIQLSHTTTIRIGEIWLGRRRVLPKGFAELERESQFATVTNGEFGVEREPMREALTWVWPALRPVDADVMRLTLREAGGHRDPVVVMPSATRPSEVYLGRLTPPRTTLHLGPYESGHAIQFVEGRRALG